MSKTPALSALVALAMLAGCTTELPKNASCHERWEAYAMDREHGAMLGGLLGASMSGNLPDCSFEQRAPAAVVEGVR
jgi:hypothetical protein